MTRLPLLLTALIGLGCSAADTTHVELTYPPLQLQLHEPGEEPMAQRFTTRVSTRTPGAVVSSADENAVEDRIIQNSADLGGVPGDLNTDDNSSFTDAINELEERAGNTWAVPGIAFDCDLTDHSFLVKDNNGLQSGQSGGTMEAWAPIDLPNGEALTTLEVFATLTTSSCQVVAALRTLDKSTGSTATVATVTLTGSSGFQSDTVTFAHTVDTDAYVYSLYAEVTNDSTNAAILKAVEVR